MINLTLFVVLNVASAQKAINGWVIDNIHGPSQIGIVDTIPVGLNHDGLMDVVSASIEDGHLRAYINQGNLEFEQQYISTEVLGAFRVAATDFNNDGEVDFLIPSIETQEIIALIADEKAESYGYRRQTIAADVLLPTDAQAGDFNNDGLMDVVSISFEENVVLLHLQNQQGEFETTIISKEPQKPRKIVVEDFNNDNNLDFLLASEEDNSVRLFAGNGAGAFDATVISSQLTGIRYIARCDMPDAEFPNFLAGVTGANQVVFFQNQGNGIFSEKLIDDNLPGANALHCADTDNDQKLELMAIAASTGNIYHYEVNPQFSKTLIANTRDGYANVSFANFENEALPKIITQAFFENRNLLLSPHTANDESVVWEDFPEGASKVAQTDINLDGYADVVATSFRDDRIQWYDGQNGSHHIIAEGIDGAADFVLGDFNKDGYVDIVSAASFGNKFYLHTSNNGISFTTSILFDGALFANSLAVSDLDQDGWLDVVGTSASDDRLRWFKFSENNTEVIDLGMTGDAPNDVEIGDIEGDGDNDIALVNFFSGEVILYKNDGDSFVRNVISVGWSRPYAILLSVKDDLVLNDILVTMSGDDQIIEFNQESVLIFKENIVIDAFKNPRKIIKNESEVGMYFTSPDNKNVVTLTETGGLRPIIENYIGVSDVNQTDELNKLLTSSIKASSILQLKKDLIFISGFHNPQDLKFLIVD